MVVGFYMAVGNDSAIGSLILLSFSIYFLLYNLVNLPFLKVYHNYRACLCHLSQFLILYVAMYYRSMIDVSDPDSINKLAPVYFELVAIGLCILVSLIVLIL